MVLGTVPGDGQRQRAQRDSGAGPGDSRCSRAGSGAFRPARRNRSWPWMASRGWFGSRPMRTRSALSEDRRQAWLARPAHRRSRNGTDPPRRAMAGVSGFSPTSAEWPKPPEAVEHGAEGVGVLRTEFLFLGRTQAPDEEEQLPPIAPSPSRLGGRPLCIRALDIGGDKSLPYVESARKPTRSWAGAASAVLLSRPRPVPNPTPRHPPRRG